MVAEGQVPADEPASYALEEFGNGFLTIFWLSQHALDGVRSKTPARDVDRHGISSLKEVLLAQSCGRPNITATATTDSRDDGRGGIPASQAATSVASLQQRRHAWYPVRMSSHQCRSWVNHVEPNACDVRSSPRLLP